eukprot:jgi/Mesvir1/6158/Mv25340-RA.1
MSDQRGSDAAAEGRPKLSLAKRSADADSSARSKPASSKPNPFGDAKPREQIIAAREGKKEVEVLQEVVKKEWAPTIVLTEAQREEKKALEAEIAFSTSEIEKTTDPIQAKQLKDELASKQAKLDEMLATFAKMAVSHAQSGGTRVSDRHREERTGDREGYENFGSGGARGGGDHYAGGGYGSGRDYGGSFGGGRHHGGGDHSFGDAWGNRRGGGGGAGGPCYNCGEVSDWLCRSAREPLWVGSKL